jgi:biopolymer transport protein ExbB
MNAIVTLMDEGGPVMFAILGLSLLLYSRCFKLLLSLRRARRALRGISSSTDRLIEFRDRSDDLQRTFRQQRVALGSMVAAAPLLGLLGTVSGMAKTFESLSSRSADSSMEGLAGGISEVLVATQSGLVVAIPALLFIYLGHREVRYHVQAVNDLEAKFSERVLA